MSAGTIALTNGSTAVAGTGTAFTSDLAVSGFLVASVGGTAYTLGIKSIESDTGLTLTQAYDGPTASGVSFDYVPMATLSLITSALAAQVSYAIRGLNLDKANWQQIFSGTGNVTINLPDGTSYTGPAWNAITTTLAGKLDKTGGTLTGNLTGTGFGATSPAGTTGVIPGSLEIYSATPLIDFHYNSSADDYTARIIHDEAAALTVSAASGNISFRVNGGLRVGGANYSGGINIYRGNGNADALFGINCSDGNLNFVKGSASNAVLNLGSMKIHNQSGVQGRRGLSGATEGNYYNFYWNSSSQIEAWIDISNVGTVSLTATSDRELKNSITYRDDAADALQQVLQWKPATFRMKARGIIPESGEKLGFIANDLVTVSPECVSGKGLPEGYNLEENPNPESPYYLNEVPMIVKLAQAIQAQQQIITGQNEAIATLQSRIVALEEAGS